MIQPLRRLHFRAFIVLTPILPAILVLSILARRPPIPINSAPELVSSSPLSQSSRVVWETAVADGGTLTGVRLLESAGQPAPAWLELVSGGDRARSEQLIYWKQGAAADSISGATLLGRMAPRHTTRVRVPAGVGRSAGHLYLYSLVHDRIQNTVALPVVP